MSAGASSPSPFDDSVIPHYVYVYYDCDDNPLYVGETSDVQRRDGEHRRAGYEKDWYSLYASGGRVEEYRMNGRRAGKAYEAILINGLRPPFNRDIPSDAALQRLVDAAGGPGAIEAGISWYEFYLLAVRRMAALDETREVTDLGAAVRAQVAATSRRYAAMEAAYQRMVAERLDSNRRGKQGGLRQISDLSSLLRLYRATFDPDAVLVIDIVMPREDIHLSGLSQVIDRGEMSRAFNFAASLLGEGSGNAESALRSLVDLLGPAQSRDRAVLTEAFDFVISRRGDVEWPQVAAEDTFAEIVRAVEDVAPPAVVSGERWRHGVAATSALAGVPWHTVGEAHFAAAMEASVRLTDSSASSRLVLLAACAAARRSGWAVPNLCSDES